MMRCLDARKSVSSLGRRPPIRALALLSVLAAATALIPAARSQPQRQGGAVMRKDVPVTSAAAPRASLNSYEADMGPFHLKLEGGTATQGAAGYKLTGGSVSIWLSSDPTKKLTIKGADIEAFTTGDTVTGIKGKGQMLTADFLKGASFVSKTFGAPMIETEQGGSRIKVEAFYNLFGVEFPVDLTLSDAGFSGKGQVGRGGETKYPEGTVTTAGGYKIIPTCMDPKASAEVDSKESPSAKAKGSCGSVGWTIVGPDGKEVTKVWGDPHPGSEADGAGQVSFTLPDRTKVAAEIDVQKGLRDACVRTMTGVEITGGSPAEQAAYAEARAKAVQACNAKFPKPPAPGLPAAFKIKLSNFIK